MRARLPHAKILAEPPNPVDIKNEVRSVGLAQWVVSILMVLLYRKSMRKSILTNTFLEASLGTVGFHNFNLLIFNLRISNPNELPVDAFLTPCRVSMCQGSAPKKQDEIPEIDCITRFGIIKISLLDMTLLIVANSLRVIALHPVCLVKS